MRGNVSSYANSAGCIKALGLSYTLNMFDLLELLGGTKTFRALYAEDISNVTGVLWGGNMKFLKTVTNSFKVDYILN